MSSRRVIVSFTTTPFRLPLLEPIIKNICETQVDKPTKLVLYVPPVFKRTGELYVVPDSILSLQQKYPIFEIRHVEEDKGPITKIYYALKEFTEPTDILISIDDDALYERHFIQEFLDGNQKQSDAMLGFMGITDNHTFIHAEFIQHRHPQRQFRSVEILGGFRGILYPRRLIHDDFFTHADTLNQKHRELQNTSMLEDDTYISRYCKLKGISQLVLGTYIVGNPNATNLYEFINVILLDENKQNGLYSSGINDKLSSSRVIIDEYFALLSKE
jgi:hypothetical protein